MRFTGLLSPTFLGEPLCLPDEVHIDRIEQHPHSFEIFGSPLFIGYSFLTMIRLSTFSEYHLIDNKLV
jgi:hypothetical protein